MARILIADDEQVARVTLAEILRLEGYEIETADSGDKAVQLLREQPFDVLILDLKMPGMGGMDVLKSVVDSLPNLSVIVLTAHGTMDTAIQAIRYRVHDYLLKPISPDQILLSIEDALRKRRMAGVSEERAGARAQMEQLPGGATLAWDRRLISWADGSLSLTPTEARLLKTLFDHRNELVPHAELVFLIQGYRIDTEEAAKILRPVVSRLRQKLAAVPGWGDRIKNVRGAGYVLELD